MIANPVYVVVVLDASNSMDNPSIKKWNNAVQGVRDFATEVQKKVPSAQLALVKFAGTTTVGKLTTVGVTTQDEVEVEITGKVIVNYITKDGKKLTESIEINGLVGSDYETIKKEFEKYSFIKLEGNKDGKIIDGILEVTYIYDLTPLPPYTGLEISNNNTYLSYIASFIGLVVIQRGIVLRKN